MRGGSGGSGQSGVTVRGCTGVGNALGRHGGGPDSGEGVSGFDMDSARMIGPGAVLLDFLTGRVGAQEGSAVQAAATLTVAIDNLPQIAAAYSQAAADRLLQEIRRRIGAGLDIGVWEPSPEASGMTLRAPAGRIAAAARADLEWCVEACALRPVDIGGERVVAALSLRGRPAAGQAEAGPFDAALYRADMRHAASAYAAIASGRALFAEQPVAGIAGGAELYRECLLRLTDGQGRRLLPGDVVPALERLGLTRAFDRQVVRKLVGELRRRPGDVLGCNISALSAANDFWWASLLSELSLDRPLAARLVIEITPTAAVPDMPEAVAFVAALRATGARVALDGFGVRVNTIAFAHQGTIDIIKIDSSYLHLSRTDEGRLLGHLALLARDLADEVVVEGVESEADLQLASGAGARWAQGHHITPAGEDF